MIVNIHINPVNQQRIKSLEEKKKSKYFQIPDQSCGKIVREISITKHCRIKDNQHEKKPESKKKKKKKNRVS